MMTEPENNPEMGVPVGMTLFPWWLVLLWGILSLIVGLMFLITPIVTVTLFIVFIGAYWLIGGCITLGSLVVDKNHRGWKIFLAAINIIAGLIVLAYPLFSAIFILAFFIIFIGFCGCFIGFAHIYQAYVKEGYRSRMSRRDQPDLRHPPASLSTRRSIPPPVHHRCFCRCERCSGNHSLVRRKETPVLPTGITFFL